MQIIAINVFEWYLYMCHKIKIDGNRNSYKIIDLWISEMTNDTIRKWSSLWIVKYHLRQFIRRL